MKTITKPTIHQVFLLTISLLCGAINTATADHELNESKLFDADHVDFKSKISPSTNAAIRQVKIEIIRDGSIVSYGTGSLFGNGLILTAAHVVDHVGVGDRIQVRNLMLVAPATVEAIGDRFSRDVALLMLDHESDRSIGGELGESELCASTVTPGQELLIAAEGGTYTTYGSQDMKSFHSGAVSTDYVTALLSSGASGAAIYDSETGCLAGVVSMFDRTEMNNVVTVCTTRFTPIEEVRALQSMLSAR